MTDDRFAIDAALVRRLIATQFPEWANLPVRRVAANGWDNSTFRLGHTMKVRLPTAERYVAQVEKEYLWLPRLAPLLPLPIPEPLAIGTPAGSYPWPWSVYRWLEGETAAPERIVDQRRFAIEVVEFLLALQRIDAAGGPPAGKSNFHRGGSLEVYDAETRSCIAALRGEIDAEQATAVWEAAISARWRGPSVWVHGDVAAGNLLVQDGRLSAIIDFGSCAVGDPACDLVLAYTFLTEDAREAFRTTVAVNEATWARARGWALWKALLTLSGNPAIPFATEPAHRIVANVLSDHGSAR